MYAHVHVCTSCLLDNWHLKPQFSNDPPTLTQARQRKVGGEGKGDCGKTCMFFRKTLVICNKNTVLHAKGTTV